ncbi:hypothetical protein V3851_26350 [Paenibacillus sp. M1]|uniref:Protein kinase domain-containing protein n=1 Tax=Paenibacillus haidiansis TaxID=1574488 RepID=A0ABU7W287_9BACL
MFPPEQDDLFSLQGRNYRVEEHPRFAGVPYGQEGRQGTVYQIIRQDDGEAFALKVFRPSFRYPTIVNKAEFLAKYSTLPGLKACSRMVIHPQQNKELLGTYPELLYAVQMPWIDGDTWSDLLIAGQEISLEHSIRMAESFIQIMMGLEENGLAHTDLSSSNVLIETSAEEPCVQLVDLEDLYMNKLEEPDDFPDVPDGYKAPFMVRPEWQWSPYADRFSGGILLAEMLTWSDPEIRVKCWEDSYFNPEELQQPNERQQLMVRTLERLYGTSVCGLFERLWSAEQPQQCPSFGEWSVALASSLEQAAKRASEAIDDERNDDSSAEEPDTLAIIREDSENEIHQRDSVERMLSEEMESMLNRARASEMQGKLAAALWDYGRLIDSLQQGSSLRREIEMVMTMIQEKMDIPEAERPTNIGKIQQQYKATTQEGTNLYAKLWIVLLGLSLVILLIAVVVYLI